jgi:hypothetical protein
MGGQKNFELAPMSAMHPLPASWTGQGHSKRLMR